MTLRLNKSGLARFSPYMALAIGLMLLSFAGPGISAAQLRQEYFVRQEPKEALLIRITAFEAEIEARVFTAERRLLLSSTMPPSRLVPLFQFIDTTSKARQLDIEVTSERSTANSKIGIEFTRLAAWDKRSGTLIRAYSLLSFGMQSSTVDNAADWTVKINSLMSAGDIFAQYGMQELRLWSAYLAAHLVSYRLRDYNMVLGLTREILAVTNGSRWQEIELAALQLRAAALIGLRKPGSLKATDSEPDPVQAALMKAADRAESMGYAFEKAFTISQSALDYESHSLYPKALEQYRSALEITDSIGAVGLATSIRESIAQLHAGQGDDPATSKVLQEIETQLVAEGGGDELALNLLQQGRIFMRSYRYPQAIEVLLQALGFENDSSIRNQVNLELAKAYFETGQNSDSLGYLQAAGISRQQASGYFLQGYQAAISNPSSLKYTAEAMYQRARSLARQGQRGKAINVLEKLIDEVLFLRQSLPGVLGAWYWQRHEQLFEYYLDLQTTASKQDNSAALNSLLALSKMRYSTLPGADSADSDPLRTRLEQAETRGRGNSKGGLGGRVSRELNARRASFNAESRFLSKGAVRKFLQGLARDEALLTYHITPSSAYVWFARDGQVQQRKITNAQKLYADLTKARKNLSESPGNPSATVLAGLGERLLGPLAGQLPETLYLIPAGLLMGFPMEALRVNDRFLVERHGLVNLLSFPANPNPQASLRPGSPQKVFLAGHPEYFSAGFATRLKTSAEIQAVTDIFIGPGLHIIQGRALLPDEFQGELFVNTDLAHLSMPASIDLGHPERSGLELSEALRGLGRTPFRQADIRSLKLQIRLVFLSASQTVGQPRSRLGTEAGVVSAFLDAGADAVIASLWRKKVRTGEAVIADGLITGFYRNMEASGNIAAALVTAKRQYLQANRGQESIDWARFQIFID